MIINFNIKSILKICSYDKSINMIEVQRLSMQLMGKLLFSRFPWYKKKSNQRASYEKI